MKFSEMKPMLGWTPEFGHELKLLCPECKKQFAISVSLDGHPKPPATWGLTLPEVGYSWDEITLTPSVGNHPQARDVPKCNYHFTVTKGEVRP